MDQKSVVLLSVAYLGPIQYFGKIISYPNVLIEQHDTFGKQSYRNRCRIFGANGPLSLSIPVQRASQHKIKVKDVKIDYSEDWQKQHWKSIESAYRSAAFYEYYHDELEPFYQRKYDFLIDFTNEIQDAVLSCIGITPDITYTNDFIIPGSEEVMDYREMIHPKKSIHDPLFSSTEYFQVFSDKSGFQPNLSIIDLLFNMGPDAVEVLKKSII
ncbi:MAG: WbqC family protein [Bacteroidales bacterium]|nr:WbqC family protein [Bacteroidales bacterium]